MLPDANQSQPYFEESRPQSRGSSESVQSWGSGRARSEQEVELNETQAVGCLWAQSGESPSRQPADGEPVCRTCPRTCFASACARLEDGFMATGAPGTPPRSRSASTYAPASSSTGCGCPASCGRHPTSDDVSETESRPRAHTCTCANKQDKRSAQSRAGDRPERKAQSDRRDLSGQAGRPEQFGRQGAATALVSARSSSVQLAQMSEPSDRPLRLCDQSGECGKVARNSAVCRLKQVEACRTRVETGHDT